MGVPSCRLMLDGDQALRNSEFTQLHWQAPSLYVTTDREGDPPEVFDPEGMFRTTLPPAFVMIRQDGVYRLWVSAKFADRDRNGSSRKTGRRAISVQMNDGNRDTLVSLPADPGGTTTLYAGIDLPLSAGDRISIWLEQQSGATINAIGQSAKDTTFGIAWDRPLPVT